MLRRLSTVRRRVERLAKEAATAGCTGHHQRGRVVTVYGDDPMPPWPEAAAGARCVCGVPLTYRSVVNRLHLEPHPLYSQGETSRGAH